MPVESNYTLMYGTMIFLFESSLIAILQLSVKQGRSVLYRGICEGDVIVCLGIAASWCTGVMT